MLLTTIRVAVPAHPALIFVTHNQKPEPPINHSSVLARSMFSQSRSISQSLHSHIYCGTVC